MPAALTAASPAPAVKSPEAPQDLPAPFVLSANSGEPVNLAVEVTWVVPLSGNLCVCQQ